MLFEEVFLIVLGIVWIGFATIQDMKKREIANWLNFSLIIFALGFRFFWSLFSGLGNEGGFSFFYYGLIGFGIFLVLGNLLYYGRVFAGGDAKLMIALGTILPLSGSLSENFNIFVWFFVLFLIAGAIYGIIISTILGIKNHKKLKKEFLKQFNKQRKIIHILLILGVLLIMFAFIINILFYLAIFVFVIPYFYLIAKSIDESSMIKSVKSDKLTEGDWLYKDVKIGKKLIKANWEGISKDDIFLFRKAKKSVLIRQGIPFTPVFLISLLVLIVLWKLNILFLFF